MHRSMRSTVAALLLAARVGTSTTATAEDDDRLARITRLDDVVERALAENPTLAEARARVQASQAAAHAAGGLDDPEFKTELWNAPLSRPTALRRADSLLVGLRQTFPAWGSRDARTKVGQEEAAMAGETLRAREQDIVTQARKAYYDLVRTEREIEVHREHADLAGRIVELTRAEYRAGRHTQPEVLQTMVELTRLHTDVVGLEQERASSRAMLNLLMGRPPEAALGAPEALTPAVLTKRSAALGRQHSSTRPEIAVAERAVARGEANVDLAHRNATYPSLTIGADYWNNPTRDTINGYGASVMLNLPWLSPRRRDELHQAEGELAAERSALAAVRNTAQYQVADARVRTESAQHGFELIDTELLPRARQSFEATEAGFAAGQGDAVGVLSTLRAYLEVRLEHARALVRFAQSLADWERAVGPTGDVHD